MTDEIRHMPGGPAPTYFTVTCHLAPIVADLSQDSDYNPNTARIDAVVTFTPKLRTGEVIHAHTALPPTGFLPLPVTAMIDDGYLKLRSKADLGAVPLPLLGVDRLKAKLAKDGNTAMQAQLAEAESRALNYAPVRLLGNSDLLEVDPEHPLGYDFQFSNIKIDGKTTNISITGGYFEAPWEDTVIDLLDYMPLTPGPYAQPMVVGPQGPPGPPGPATVDVGSTTTSDPGSDAQVTNSGDNVSAVFDFVIPRGAQGPPGQGFAEYPTEADLPAAGTPDTLYLVADTGDIFRWSGSKATGYQRISERVTSTGIEDSSQVGRDVLTAVDAASARAVLGAEAAAAKGQPDGYAPLGADGIVPAAHLPARTVIDLRDWPDVKAANWGSVLANYTVGSTALSPDVPFTAGDVGKIVMLFVNNTAGSETWWKGSIVSVDAAGTATLDRPVTEGPGRLRCRYGFDGTTALNAALKEVGATLDGPVEVRLGGQYRLTQLVVPFNVVIRGVPWFPNMVQQSGNSSKTILAQLPGAEKDFIVFENNPYITGCIVGCGLAELEVRGPEFRVSGMPAATKGNGVALRVVESSSPTGTAPASVVDGFRLEKVSVYDFPESGFRCHGAVPMYVNDCKALYNGRYGFEHYRYGGSVSNALHIFNFSSDWNNLGAVFCKDWGANDSVWITSLKSEGHVAGMDADSTRGGPNFQSTAIVIEDCDNTPIFVNGLSHIRVGRAKTGPGPGITINDTSKLGRKPRLTYDGVVVRVWGGETAGTTGDAVTIRDTTTASTVDIPRTVSSGSYPAMFAPPKIVDKNGKNFIFLSETANATASFNVGNSPSGGPPYIAVADSTQANVGLALVPKGNASVQITASAAGITPTINASSPDAVCNLAINGKGVGGVVTTGGVQVDVKGHTHVAGDVVGVETTARKGVANGYASLDNTVRLPAAQLPVSAVEWKGEWNAATNTPALANGTGQQGDIYRVNTAGTNLGITVAAGDAVIYDGLVYRKLGGGPWTTVPATATSPGTAGQLAYANGFLYVCVAANTWQRTALTTW